MRVRTAMVMCGVCALAACREKPRPSAPPLPADTVAARPPAPKSAPTAKAPPFVPVRVRGEAAAMGTHLAFAAYTTPALDEAKVRAAFDAAVAEIKRVEALMTTWRPDSAVSKVNAAAGKHPVEVDDETYRVIAEAVHASEISQGTFDITFETLHGLWKFDEDLDPHPPSKRAIEAKLPFVGYQGIKLDPAHKSVMLDKPETRIGLGGIAKGYGVDRAVAVLDEAGLTSFFVQAGGDLFARGKKADGTLWQAGIRDPRGPDGRWFAKLALEDHAFSTAGDYERSYVVGGKRYHHIIDPRTGYPATASRSVTLYAPTALLADAIDDAVFILGPKKGLALVESLDGVGAVIVDAKNNVWISKRLQGKVLVAGAPSEGL